MRRSTLIMVALFAIALVALILLQKNPEFLQASTPTPEATPMAKLLPNWTEQDVTETVLSRMDGTETRLTRNPDASWNNAAAGTVAAGKVEQLLSELLATNVLVNLPASTSLDDLGLAAPGQTITLVSGDGRTSTILVGAMTPTQSGYYVKVDDRAPCAVSKYAVEAVLQLYDEALPAEEATATP